MKSKLAIFTTALLLSSAAAQADVAISSKPTQNMSCDAGVCTATAQKAVLNVNDLQNMLASGDVAVKTGSVTNNINIDQPLIWTSTSRLTLDAQQSVVVKRPVTVAGTGALTVTTNDGGQNGEFIVIPKHGSVQLWDLANSLIIDGTSYTLVDDIKTLAAAISTNPSGYYALAKPYDASADGTYTSAPISTDFTGTFQGLGNTISNLSLSDDEQQIDSVGLFSRAYAPARLLNTGLVNADIEGSTVHAPVVGALIGDFESGLIDRCWSLVHVNFNAYFAGDVPVGGLVGASGGTISNSSAVGNIYVFGPNVREVGGLVGSNGGRVLESFARTNLLIYSGAYFEIGGLIGQNYAHVEHSFSDGRVRSLDARGDGAVGGLVGGNHSGGTLVSSYTAASAHAKPKEGVGVGGVIGLDDSVAGSVDASYWDLDQGVTDPSKGAGNIPNDPGIKGLTTTQLQRKLPRGFSARVWGLNPKINHGLPYLLDNPPK